MEYSQHTLSYMKAASNDGKKAKSKEKKKECTHYKENRRGGYRKVERGRGRDREMEGGRERVLIWARWASNIQKATPNTALHFDQAESSQLQRISV